MTNLAKLTTISLLAVAGALIAPSAAADKYFAADKYQGTLASCDRQKSTLVAMSKKKNITVFSHKILFKGRHVSMPVRKNARKGSLGKAKFARMSKDTHGWVFAGTAPGTKKVRIRVDRTSGGAHFDVMACLFKPNKTGPGVGAYFTGSTRTLVYPRQKTQGFAKGRYVTLWFMPPKSTKRNGKLHGVELNSNAYVLVLVQPRGKQLSTASYEIFMNEY